MMGSTEFAKWPIVDGSNETWLEYSYYSFLEGIVIAVLITECLLHSDMIQKSYVSGAYIN